MATPTHKISVLADGSLSLNIGTQYYQLKDDFGIWGQPRTCAFGGCPAVVPFIDDADTIFDLHWQLYTYAINKGMSLNAIVNTMEDAAALMNTTGVTTNHNYLTGENADAPDARLDKLRGMCLDTYGGYDDGVSVYLDHLDGNNPPLMKAGRPRPTSIENVIPEDYSILPSMPQYRHLFIVCKNVKWKPATQTLDYGAFDNGLIRSWTGDNVPYTFFPLVSQKSIVKLPLNWFNKVTSIQSPYRH